MKEFLFVFGIGSVANGIAMKSEPSNGLIFFGVCLVVYCALKSVVDYLD